MRFTAAWALLLLTGCPPVADDTGDVVLNEVDPYWFWVVGNFGYDLNADEGSRYVAYTVDGQTVNPGVSITLATEEYAREYDDTLACSIVLESEGPLGQASWVSDANIDLGFELPEDATVSTNCDFSELDSELWGDDPLTRIVEWGWGVGLDQLDEELAAPLIAEVDATEGQDWATDYEPFVAGGGFYSGVMVTDENPGGWTNSAMTRAFMVDETMTVMTDEAGVYQQHPGTDISDGVPPTGAYVTTTLSFLNGAETLADLPANLDSGDTGDTGE